MYDFPKKLSNFALNLTNINTKLYQYGNSIERNPPHRTVALG